MIEIHRSSETKAKAEIIGDTDPTAFSPSWTFQVHGTEPPKPADTPSAWTAGSWRTIPGEQVGDYRWVGVTLSPVIGAAGLDLAAGVYDMYVTLPAGPFGNPVLAVGMVRVR